MNLRNVKTKTLSADSSVGLDDAIAAFRDTVPNATFIAILFSYEDGTFASQIIYTE